jgi:hypothetical protein
MKQICNSPRTWVPSGNSRGTYGFTRLLYYSYNSFWHSRRGPPLWSSGQSSWLQILKSRVRFPALPHFLRSSGSGTGSTQPREDNWGATWMKKVAASVKKDELTAVGICCAEHATLSIRKKLTLTSPTSGGRSVGIVCLRTNGHGV